MGENTPSDDASDSSPRSAGALISARYSDLTKGQRKVASFILGNPHEAALMTLEELAFATDVSRATADRLAKRLGLSSHHELKQLLKQEARRNLRPVQEAADVVLNDQLTSALPWTESLQEDIRLIRQITEANPASAFAQATNLFKESRRILFVGFGSSAFIAQYAAFCLSALRENCEAVTDSGGIEGVFRKLQDADASDVAVQISFPRYSRSVLSTADHLRRNRVPVIGITDTAASPLSRLSNICFYADRKSGWTLTGSAIGAMALTEALLRATAAAIGHSVVAERSARLTGLLNESVLLPSD